MIEFEGDFYLAAAIEAVVVEYTGWLLWDEWTLSIGLKSGSSYTYTYHSLADVESVRRELARKIKEESLFPTH